LKVSLPFLSETKGESFLIDIHEYFSQVKPVLGCDSGQNGGYTLEISVDLQSIDRGAGE
jgi:hypothetical protein